MAVRRPNGDSQLIGGLPHLPTRNMRSGRPELAPLRGDSVGVAEAVATRMRADGASVELIARPAVLDEKHIASVVGKAAPIYRPLHGAALLWALDAPASFDDTTHSTSQPVLRTRSALFAFVR